MWTNMLGSYELWRIKPRSIWWDYVDGWNWRIKSMRWDGMRLNRWSGPSREWLWLFYVNQVLHFVLEGPIVIGVMPRCIHVKCAMKIRIVTLWWTNHEFRWVLCMSLAFFSFGNNWDRGLKRGVKLQGAFLKFWEALVEGDIVDDSWSHNFVGMRVWLLLRMVGLWRKIWSTSI